MADLGEDWRMPVEESTRDETPSPKARNIEESIDGTRGVSIKMENDPEQWEEQWWVLPNSERRLVRRKSVWTIETASGHVLERISEQRGLLKVAECQQHSKITWQREREARNRQ